MSMANVNTLKPTASRMRIRSNRDSGFFSLDLNHPRRNAAITNVVAPVAIEAPSGAMTPASRKISPTAASTWYTQRGNLITSNSEERAAPLVDRRPRSER
jgi:hypothetical protein